MEEEIGETDEIEGIEVEAKRGGEIDLTQGPNHVLDLIQSVIATTKRRKSVHTMTTEVEIIAETEIVETAVVIEIVAEVATEIVEIANAMIAGAEEVVHHIKRVRSVMEVLVARVQEGTRDLVVPKRAQRNLHNR